LKQCSNHIGNDICKLSNLKKTAQATKTLKPFFNILALQNFRSVPKPYAELCEHSQPSG